MTTTTASTPSSRSFMTMIRWVFQRDGQALTCEVDARGPQSYDVAVVPLWDRSAAIVENFTGPLSAFELHASIARELRDRGWVLVDHANPRYAAVA